LKKNTKKTKNKEDNFGKKHKSKNKNKKIKKKHVEKAKVKFSTSSILKKNQQR
jgi:hypothetical protein